MARRSSFDDASAGFRAHLPDLSSPRFTTAAKQNVYEYVGYMQDNRAPPWLYDLTKVWEVLLEEPYKGITSDGTVQEGLYETRDEGFTIEDTVQKAEGMLQSLSEEQRGKVSYPLNAREWRAWSNPEFLLRPFGLRLEEVPESTAQSILFLIAASLSEEGYAKALAAMRINHFLGELVNLPQIMNKYSYNFLLFGKPSASSSSPWGWLLYGHHLSISIFFKGPQVIISPTFTGAEPNVIDDGPWAGTEVLHRESTLALALMQSLRPELQAQAQIYTRLRDPAMKQAYALSGNDASKRSELITDTWAPDDQRHRCGAFRDNRTVPYEGVRASLLTPAQQEVLLALCGEFLLYLPQRSRALKLADVERRLSETFVCWYGGFGDADAFYVRVQSPILLCELDHHSGVFLTNEEPAKYHTHTIVRTPHGGDYGQALRREGERLA